MTRDGSHGQGLPPFGSKASLSAGKGEKVRGGAISVLGAPLERCACMQQKCGTGVTRQRPVGTAAEPRGTRTPRKQV